MIIIMRCKNCKFFKREENKDRWSCKCDKFFYNWPMSEKRKAKKDELEYRDYEYYSAWFDVWEDFWCIHFKK